MHSRPESRLVHGLRQLFKPGDEEKCLLTLLSQNPWVLRQESYETG